MTSLGIGTDVKYDRRSGDGWPKPLISVLGIILFAILGWAVNDYLSTRTAMQAQLNANSQRIAVQEEVNRNNRDQLNRIESLVLELRQQQQRDGRGR